MKANDLYTRWLSLNSARQSLYQSLTEQDLWGDEPAVQGYYDLANEQEDAWVSYVAHSNGISKEQASANIEAKMHSARD